MIRLELTTPPSQNHLFPSNSGGGGRHQSAEYRRWIKDSETALWLTKLTHIKGPVEVSIRYEDAGKVDLDNLLKALLDFCVKYELIENDHREIVRKLTAVWDKTVKGCVVEIKETKI